MPEERVEEPQAEGPQEVAPGWFFYQVTGSNQETEERIWAFLENMKKENKGTKEMATLMRDQARALDAQGKKGDAYLWALIVGKVFGLFGV